FRCRAGQPRLFRRSCAGAGILFYGEREVCDACGGVVAGVVLESCDADESKPELWPGDSGRSGRATDGYYRHPWVCIAGGRAQAVERFKIVDDRGPGGDARVDEQLSGLVADE